ncbi:TPA: DUF1372 family protein [Streptococcus suis]
MTVDEIITTCHKINTKPNIYLGEVQDVIDGHYYVEVSPYGKFLVTREQYEAVEIGQEMPEYLKGRKQ